MAWLQKLSLSRCRWILGVLGVLLAIAVGWGATAWRAHRIDAYLREALLYQATAIAQNVDPALAKALTFTPADKGTPAYERLRAQFTAYGQIIPNHGIYTMALRDGQILFGPENYPENDPMASPPGTVYQEPGPEDFDVLQTGRVYTIGPVSDEYGTFVSALAPVLDPQTDHVIMAVGIDILAED
ncbi:MAG: GGDEF domain-containing protein, partial [Chloroflexi bacterium]|nr:GGDEF domain-containing protein [Chloroflexota bacterium]